MSDATVTIETHPDGFEHAKATVAKMGQLIIEFSSDYTIRHLATEITKDLPSKSPTKELYALYQWVRKNIRYRRDPRHIEWLQTPTRTLKERAGDCDCIATLIGALAESLGHKTRITTIGPSKICPKHVAIEAWDGKRWVTLDPVLEGEGDTGEVLPGKFGLHAKGSRIVWNTRGTMIGAVTNMPTEVKVSMPAQNYDLWRATSYDLSGVGSDQYWLLPSGIQGPEQLAYVGNMGFSLKKIGRAIGKVAKGAVKVVKTVAKVAMPAVSKLLPAAVMSAAGAPLDMSLKTVASSILPSLSKAKPAAAAPIAALPAPQPIIAAPKPIAALPAPRPIAAAPKPIISFPSVIKAPAATATPIAAAVQQAVKALPTGLEPLTAYLPSIGKNVEAIPVLATTGKELVDLIKGQLVTAQAAKKSADATAVGVKRAAAVESIARRVLRNATNPKTGLVTNLGAPMNMGFRPTISFQLGGWHRPSDDWPYDVDVHGYKRKRAMVASKRKVVGVVAHDRRRPLYGLFSGIPESKAAAAAAVSAVNAYIKKTGSPPQTRIAAVGAFQKADAQDGRAGALKYDELWGPNCAGAAKWYLGTTVPPVAKAFQKVILTWRAPQVATLPAVATPAAAPLYQSQPAPVQPRALTPTAAAPAAKPKVAVLTPAAKPAAAPAAKPKVAVLTPAAKPAAAPAAKPKVAVLTPVAKPAAVAKPKAAVLTPVARPLTPSIVPTPAPWTPAPEPSVMIMPVTGSAEQPTQAEIIMMQSARATGDKEVIKELAEMRRTKSVRAGTDNGSGGNSLLWVLAAIMFLRK